MSRVSVVIPAFNQGRFLAEAVESVLSQAHDDLEVVIVDDGSTDETAAVCETLKQKSGVRVLRQSNTGVGAARNRGAQEATGTYLCFLDADDYFLPGKIARQAAILDRAPDVDFVYCDIVTIDESGRPLDEQYSVAESRRQLTGDIFDPLVVGGYFPPHVVMIRREAFARLGGFDPDLGGNADLDLWLRAAAAGSRADFVDERLVGYRTHSAGMSRDRDHMRDTRIAAFAKIARLHPERVARAISHLQELHEDLHRGNAWLNQTLHEVMLQIPSEPLVRWTMLDDMAEGRSITDTPEQAAVWDVTIDRFDRTLVLHPPASIRFTVPSGEAFRLAGAIALHPDVWDHADSGACLFQVTVDDRVRWVCLVDPKGRSADRGWLPFEIDVPETGSGTHAIKLETDGVNGQDFRWALWKDVRCMKTKSRSTANIAEVTN